MDRLEIRLMQLEIKIAETMEVIKVKEEELNKFEAERQSILQEEEIMSEQCRSDLERLAVEKGQVMHVVWEEEGASMCSDLEEGDMEPIRSSTQEFGHDENSMEMSQPLSDIQKVSLSDALHHGENSAKTAAIKMVKKVLKISEEEELDLTEGETATFDRAVDTVRKRLINMKSRQGRKKLVNPDKTFLSKDSSVVGDCAQRLALKVGKTDIDKSDKKDEGGSDVDREEEGRDEEEQDRVVGMRDKGVLDIEEGARKDFREDMSRTKDWGEGRTESYRKPFSALAPHSKGQKARLSPVLAGIKDWCEKNSCSVVEAVGYTLHQFYYQVYRVLFF